MKRTVKMTVGLLLALAMMAGALPVVALAEMSAPAAQAGSGLLVGRFRFDPHEVGRDIGDMYIYTDDWFKVPSQPENKHLATMSMLMASSSISSEGDDGSLPYPEKSRNVVDLLNQLGFEDVETNRYYSKQMWEQSMGCAVGHKTVTAEDGKDYTLLAIIPRSAGYEKEWAGNFTVGTEGLHKGFQTARDEVLRFARQYVTKNNITGSVKVWTVGYSRGAATANLLAGFLVDAGSGYLGVEIRPEDVYAYTFGTPTTLPAGGVTRTQALSVAGSSAAWSSDEVSSTADDATPCEAYIVSDDTTIIVPNGDRYGGIHNYLSDYDNVTMMPFTTTASGTSWAFVRYGQTSSTELDLLNIPENKTAMLSYLKRTNPTVYNSYLKADPDNFKPYRFTLSSAGLGFSAEDVSGVAATQEAYMNGRFDYVAERIIPDRWAYAAEDGYQELLQYIIRIFKGESSAVSDAFVSGIRSMSTKDLAITGGLLFAKAALDSLNRPSAASGEAKVETTAAGIAAALSAAGEGLSYGEPEKQAAKLLCDLLSSETGLYDEARAELLEEVRCCLLTLYNEGLSGEETLNDLTDEEVLAILAALRDGSFDTAAPAETAGKVANKVGKYAASLVEFLARWQMSKVLTAGFNALPDAVKASYENLTAPQTVINAGNVFASFLFGTNDPFVFSLNNTQMNTAATLINNASSLMITHNNEVLVSWLRAADSYYLVPEQEEGSSFSASTTVKLRHAPEAKVYYTLDETEPATDSALYPEAGILLSQGAADKTYTIKAISVADGEVSPVWSFTYTITGRGNGNGSGSSSSSRGSSSSSNAASETAAPANTETEPSHTDVSFKDVAPDSWYAGAVRWAVQNGITAGTGDGLFEPDKPCTRAEVVTFLWRMAGAPESTRTTGVFPDVPEDSWYAGAVRWAVENHITSGTTALTFSPDLVCDRATIAMFLFRMAGAPFAGGDPPFGDVDAGAWYADAVKWAAAAGITEGTGGGLFSPDVTCTRSQVVTFLYRFQEQNH